MLKKTRTQPLIKVYVNYTFSFVPPFIHTYLVFAPDGTIRAGSLLRTYDFESHDVVYHSDLPWFLPKEDTNGLAILDKVVVDTDYVRLFDDAQFYAKYERAGFYLMTLRKHPSTKPRLFPIFPNRNKPINVHYLYSRMLDAAEAAGLKLTVPFNDKHGDIYEGDVTFNFAGKRFRAIAGPRRSIVRSNVDFYFA